MMPLFAMRWLARAAVIVAAATCAGCFGPPSYRSDKVVWSPDGSQAAVLAEDLYLTDASGRLTPAGIDDAYLAAWLRDGQHLVLATSRQAYCFQEIADAIGPDATADLVTRARRLLWRAQGPAGTEADDTPLPADIDGILVYLREHHRDALLAIDPDEEQSLDTQTATLHSLVVVRVAERRVQIVRTLSVGFTRVHGIRPAPDGRYIAFVTQAGGFLTDETLQTFVVPADGSVEATLISRHTSIDPDWTADSRALLYLGAPAHPDRDGSLGCLFEEPVDRTARAGRRCLASLVFDPDSRIRTTASGRVLFDAPELTLPRAAEQPGTRRSSVFMYDRARPAVERVIRDRPADDLDYFEVSTDGEQLLAGWSDGTISLISIDGRDAKHVRLGSRTRYRPTWSGPGAIVYVRDDGRGPVLVRRAGDIDSVLSHSWPEPVVQRVAGRVP